MQDAETLHRQAKALAGNPPHDIADEVRDFLLQEVYSCRQAIYFGRTGEIKIQKTKTGLEQPISPSLQPELLTLSIPAKP